MRRGFVVIDAKSIKDQFNYIDGCLIRKSSNKRGYKRPDGYVVTRINGTQMYEHRLIYFLFKGVLPEQVDHVNGDRSDNRIENLRAATHEQNCYNRKRMGKSSKGCYWQPKRGKWIAQIGYKGRRRTIGYFDNEEDAKDAYSRESRRFHGIFSRCD